MGTRPHASILSPPLFFVCKQLRHLSDLPTSPPGPPAAGACVSVPKGPRPCPVPLPRFMMPPANLCPKGPSPPLLW